MYKKAPNTSNPKKVNQTYKRKRNRQNHPPLKCLCNNPSTINFKTNFPKLFNHPKVQLKKCPKWPPKAVNIILNKLILNPEIKVTKKIAHYCRKDCYIQTRRLKRNFIGTYIKSPLNPNLWIWIKFNMKI